MELRWRVAPETARWLVVDAQPGTTIRDVRDDLSACLTGPLSGWTLEGVPLHEGIRLGRWPAVDGATLRRHDGAVAASATPFAPVEVHVTSGPDAGRVVALSAGSHDVGRARGCHLRLTDPAASRHHARIIVDAEAVHLLDLGSSNGSALDDHEVRSATTRWPVGSSVTIGSSTLVLRSPNVDVLTGLPQPDGSLLINPRPNPRPMRPAVRRTRPSAPPRPSGARLGWMALALPLILSVALAVALRSWMYLAFGLFAPVMAVGQFVSDRRSGRHQRAREADEYSASLAEHEAALMAALEDEAAAAWESFPDPATAVATCLGRGARLWERLPADPTVRVGHGPAHSHVVEVVDGDERHPSQLDVPITIDLGAGPLGAHGPPERVERWASSVALQLATWHSPADLRLWRLDDPSESVEIPTWIDLLPHAQGPGVDAPRDAAATLAELEAIVRRRDAGAPGEEHGRHVVLTTGRWLRSQPVGRRLLSDGGTAGVFLICLAARSTDLPIECAAVVALGDASTMTDGAHGARPLVPDELSEGVARDAAWALAPLRDAHADTIRLPGAVPLRRVFDTVLGDSVLSDSVLSDSVLGGSVLSDSVLGGSVLGDNVVGATSLTSTEITTTELTSTELTSTELTSTELTTTEPTTDELSRRILASWHRRPATTQVPLGMDHSGLVAVDLRTDGPHALIAGTTGAGKSELLRTFVAMAALGNSPEHLGFVLVDYKGGSAFDRCEDLPHVAGLVTDLDAEGTARALHGLERELRRRETLLRQSASSDIDEHNAQASSPLPRLALVIDEFRALADDLPDFVDGLLRIAAQGRSLGVHLVLATQRPGGAVSADIRANVNLRIALRVRDLADAHDIVECAAPALLSSATPGRAVLRTGGDPPRTIQAAWATAPFDARTARAGWRGSQGNPELAQAKGGQSRGVSHPVTDLDVIVDAVALAARSSGLGRAHPPWLAALPPNIPLPTRPPRCGPPEGLVDIGLVDDPEAQTQYPLSWAPTTPLGIVGPPGSGRTSTLATIVATATSCSCPQHLVVDLVYATTAPKMSSMPAVATCVGLDDPPRLLRILGRLAASARAGRRLPGVRLVVIDDVDALSRTLEDYLGRGHDDLIDLLRLGPASGIVPVIAGGRSLGTGPMAALLPRRLLLGGLGLDDVILGTSAPIRPGRARVLPEGLVAQVYQPPVIPPVDARLRPDHSMNTCSHALADWAWQAPPLPVTASSQPNEVGGVDAWGEPLRLDVDHRGLVIVGTDRATTRRLALRLAQCAAARAERVVLVRRPGGTAPDGETSASVTSGSLREHADLVTSGSLGGQADLVVLPEGLDGVDESALDAVDLFRRQGGRVVLACRAAEIATTFRGLAASLRSVAPVLALGVGAAERDLLGCPLAPAEAGIPGRGVLVVDGEPRIVQFALGEDGLESR